MFSTVTLENSLQIGSKQNVGEGLRALPEKILRAGINPAPTAKQNSADRRICKIGEKG